jgi:hypothetical protein
LVNRGLVSFVTQGLSEQLAQELLAGLPVLGGQTSPQVSRPRDHEARWPRASARVGLLHGGLLSGWSRQQ